MFYDPDHHHRHSLRLKGHDYSSPGFYLVTICTQGRIGLFGEIVKHRMILNKAGEMIDNWINVLEDRFSEIQLDTRIVMPDHTHMLINIVSPDAGADRCVCPASNRKNIDGTTSKKGKHAGLPLHRVIQWFKTMTTNEYIRGVHEKKWLSFNKRLWQRNYHDQIIRNHRELPQIREYIKQNPMCHRA